MLSYLYYSPLRDDYTKTTMDQASAISFCTLVLCFLPGASPEWCGLGAVQESSHYLCRYDRSICPLWTLLSVKIYVLR